MSITEFFTGNGSIDIGDKYISGRIIKDNLEKRYRISVINESSKCLECKIIRYIRLYGFPVIFPHSTAKIEIYDDEGGGTSIRYRFKWPEYYIYALIPSVMFCCLSTTLHKANDTIYSKITNGLSSALCAGMFFGLLVFLDTKIVHHGVKKVLKDLL